MTKWIILALAAINLFTFCLYGWDKRCAKKHRHRVPESTLLTFAFFGGGLGAILAMRLFRHKTKHKKFIILVPIFLILQLCLAAWIFLRTKGAA